MTHALSKTCHKFLQKDRILSRFFLKCFSLSRYVHFTERRGSWWRTHRPGRQNLQLKKKSDVIVHICKVLMFCSELSSFKTGFPILPEIKNTTYHEKGGRVFASWGTLFYPFGTHNTIRNTRDHVFYFGGIKWKEEKHWTHDNQTYWGIFFRTVRLWIK